MLSKWNWMGPSWNSSNVQCSNSSSTSLMPTEWTGHQFVQLIAVFRARMHLQVYYLFVLDKWKIPTLLCLCARCFGFQKEKAESIYMYTIYTEVWSKSWIWLQWDRYGYSGIGMVTMGWIWLQWDGYGYSGIDMVTVGWIFTKLLETSRTSLCKLYIVTALRSSVLRVSLTISEKGNGCHLIICTVKSVWTKLLENIKPDPGHYSSVPNTSATDLQTGNS